jgi:MYXO-CTERM domain-containing protein
MLVEGGASTHKLHNNLAIDPGGKVTRFTGGDDSANSWNLPVTVSEADFLSMDEAEAMQPRAADGSLPAIKFLHLAEDSDLADRGMDVGLPFVGAGPDLGAFERGSETTTAPDAGMPSGDAGAPATDAGVPSAGAGAGGTGAAGEPSQAGRASPEQAGAPGAGAAAPRGGMGGAGATAGPAAGSIGQATQGVSAGAAATPAGDAADGGCSCRIASAGKKPTGKIPALLLLAAAGLVVRKRARTRAALARPKGRS